MIKISSSGISVFFEGSIKRLPSKRGLSKTTTNVGLDKTEFVRGVVNLSITIDYMTEDDYDKLTTMFISSNNRIDIEDMNRGRYFSNYYIDGEMLELDEKEDIENNTYYYVGGIQLNKR
ncbi:MAG: hypothetical protein ACRC1T_09210 [Clostridium chrysemydis]|uniref:hypothetical protein n=1 Tax=Clostridium chrysemydis TaxID=2665504 RepID=UPI003F374548